MPYKWVPPKLFVEHKGIKVFHAYKCDEPMTYFYTIYRDNVPTEEAEEEDAYYLDVRQFTTAKDGGNHKEVIVTAINNGLVYPFK